MMYGSSDMECNGQNFLSFWIIFCPFNSLTTQKNQNLEKMKKNHQEISSFLHICTKNYDQMMYHSWDMVCDRCNCYFSFWAIFCPFAHLTAQKIKTWKRWKNQLEISSFYICVPKIMIRSCTVSEIWSVIDGWMDELVEKVSYRGGCPT